MRGRGTFETSADATFRYTQRRNGSCDNKTIRRHFLQIHAAKWRTICSDHVDALWAVMDDAIHEVSRDICGGKQAMSSIVQ